MKRPYIFDVLLSSLKLKGTLLTALLALFAFAANAQVGVGTISPDASAQLDVQSTTKGALIPRMTDTDRTGILSPATGLLVYQTNGAAGFYYFDGTVWQPLLFGTNTPYGFTATKGSLVVTNDSQINAFTQLYAEGGGLNVAAGTYTVQATGIYRVSAVVNYSTTAAITANITGTVDPKIAFRVNGVEKLSGLFPVLNVNVALVLSLKAILGSGTVVISGDIPLTAGDILDLQYVADGLGVTINLGGTSTTNGIVWSVRKL